MNCRIGLLLATSLMIAGAAAGSAHAQSDYPGKPVRVIVAFPPGGATDVVARLLAAFMEKRFKQSFFVDNRPGGQTAIGMEALVKAPNDGYTLAVTGSSVVTEIVNKEFWPYRFDRDLTTITFFSGGGYAITVANNIPVANLRELVAYSKANPGKLNHAEAAGINSDMALLKHKLAMGSVETIIYKGGPLAVQAIVSGDAHMYAAAALDVMQLARDGKLKIIAYTERERHPLLPQVPTVNESGVGLTDFEGSFPFLLSGPAKLPRDIIDTLHGAVQEMLKAPDFLEKTRSMGLRTYSTSPSEAFNMLIAKRKMLEEAVASGVKLR